MSKKKQQIRQAFRDETFKRDHYSCVICGCKYTKATAEIMLDAHHITPREEMPNGGYVKENGASVCKNGLSPTCHEKAEQWLKNEAQPPGCSPYDLYAKIGSSYEEAFEASENLKPKEEEEEEETESRGYGGWSQEEMGGGSL